MRRFRDIVVRLECVIFIAALLFSSLAFSGCTIGKKETTKKEKISKSEDADEDPENEDGEDQNGNVSDGGSEDTSDGGQSTDETEPEEEEEEEPEEDPEPRALEIAAEVGLSEEDLRGEYALFLKYATAVANNPELHEYRGYIYSLFPLVADHLKRENEEYFLEQINSLFFMNVETEDFWGGFAPSVNGIFIGIDQFNSCTPGQQATGIYHELMHFIDGCIDGPYTSICLLDDGTFANTLDYPEEEWENMTIIESPYWAEGGSEKYYAQYFTYAPETGAYRVGEQFLVGLEYIFGSELVDEMFFAHDTDLRFVHLLQDNGFTNEEIVHLYNVMQLMLAREESGFSNDELLDPQETLIRLYINNVGPDYESDAAFCRILASMEDEVLKSIPSPYRDFTNTLHLFTEKEESRMIQKISSNSNYFAIPPAPLFVDGELKLVAMFFEGFDDDAVARAVIIDYDFEENEIIDFEIYDDWNPKSLYVTLPSDDTPEAQELIDSLTADNSEAHSKKIKGKQNDLTDQYARAEEIGNKYGIRFWFGDLTPDGVLFFDDVKAWDPDLIDRALDQIEAVLALYPEDYFDRFLFEYYTGIAICLYDGNYEFAYPYHKLIKNTNYLTLYVDVSLETVAGHPGADDLSTQNFRNVHPIAAELICDIWMMTEEIMSQRDEHFDEVTFSEEAWQALNPSGFEYLETDYWDELDTYSAEVDMQYFLYPGSLRTSKNDRMLLYEYLMLATLTGENPLEFTPECQAKMDTLLSMIRFYFETDQWPAETSWEQAIG
ncbi:MAG: hypothetical protein IK020_11265 [Clostridiales bacterium]|nr:hypothetical protein [Clostridiales bacterium]